MGRKKTSLAVDPALWQQFKLKCVQLKTDMSEELEEMVKAWLEAHK